MSELCVVIGELVVRVTTKSSDARQWLANYFRTTDSMSEGQGVEMQLEWGWGKPFNGFDVSIVRTSDGIVYDRGDYVVSLNDDYNQAELKVYNSFALKHALMNLYSAVVVHREWGLLIHSSCVIRGEKAYLFAGNSGAGKSTVARLSTPLPLLSDEASIVKISKGGVLVYDSPFRSDSVPGRSAEPRPLTAIHLLHQAPRVERKIKKEHDGICQLMDKVFYWAQDPSETKKILRLYRNLAAEVPIYDLYFKKDNTFWEAIS